MRKKLLAATTLSVLIALPGPGSVGTAYPQSAGRQGPEVVRLKADLVLLPVTVTDQEGRAVLNLKKPDFHVYEDEVQQKISFFNSETVPVSWGLVLDRSWSMLASMREVYEALVHALEAGTPEDEAFVVAFSDRVELVHDFTRDRQALLGSVRSLQAGGQTALYDSIHRGLEHVQKGRHWKKVLLVFTDGMDTESETRIWELLRQAEQSEALIYAVGFFHSLTGIYGGAKGFRKDLEELCRRTGGSAHFPRTTEECTQTCHEIVQEVTRQYSIGYYPSDTDKKRTWRTVRVTVGQKGSSSKYHVRTRAGYSVAKANPGDKL